MVCDVHPLTEGHILIIPKDHISCTGAFSPDLFTEFSKLYDRFYDFVKSVYGKAASFEHGVIGQTVFHAHVHLLPFEGKPEEIVPEGLENTQIIQSIDEVRQIFRKDGKYLYFSIDNSLWTVNTALGAPRFFRDRFAKALGHSERGNWKEMEANETLMNEGKKEIKALMHKWNTYTAKGL